MPDFTLFTFLNCNEPRNLWKLTWEKQQIMSDGGFKSSFICRYKMVAVCIMDKLVYCSVFALDIISCPFYFNCTISININSFSEHLSKRDSWHWVDLNPEKYCLSFASWKINNMWETKKQKCPLGCILLYLWAFSAQVFCMPNHSVLIF